MIEELKDKESTDIKYLRARMTGNVGLALDHAYNLGFFDGEKNIVKKILNYLESREIETVELQKFLQKYSKECKTESGEVEK
jgi:hypothetical protein